MTVVKVHLGTRGYDIDIGFDLLRTYNFHKFVASKYIIITDSNVNKLYGAALRKKIKKSGNAVDIITIKPGERSKTLQVAEKISRVLAQKYIDKDAILVALGGGVVGDLVGFIASFYKRGIRYIHVPTTLLAQVDSSIGGKTGINIPEGKNLLGTIYQPQAVITDITTLRSLPNKEIKNGLAEIIKYGVVCDKQFFQYIEKQINQNDPNIYAEFIKRSCGIKARVIARDENEHEFRKILNYGHTIGHALEILTNRRVSHGQAIAIGMICEGKIAMQLDVWSEVEYRRQCMLIKRAGLGISLKLNYRRLIEIMQNDKKTKNGLLYFVLPKRIGVVQQEKGRVAFPVRDRVVERVLKETFNA